MPLPRLKYNDNNLYPGPEGAKREREFMNETNPKDIFTATCVQLQDIDEEIGKLMDEGLLGLTVDDEPVPVITVDNERWAEFAKTWHIQNEDRNISPPLITIRRTGEEAGTRLGTKWTIPNRKHFTTLEVPTFENGIVGKRLFQVTQPTDIDALYEIRLIALYKEDTTQMAENFMREFSGRQLYIKVKGHYFRTTLEDTGNEDTMGEIDADRYYVRIFNIRVMGFVQRLEDFKEIDVPNRIITLTEVQGETIAHTSQSIVAATAKQPVIGSAVGISGPKVFPASNSGRGSSIIGVRIDATTNTLVIATTTEEFSASLSEIGGDTIRSISLVDGQTLRITTNKGVIQTDLSPIIPEQVKVTGASFNAASRVLNINNSDNTTVSVSIPAPLDKDTKIVSGDYSVDTRSLRLNGSDGTIVSIDLSQVSPEEVGDTIESLALNETELTITTDKGTHTVNLETLNPLYNVGTLEYFQGFTLDDITNVTNNANWNQSGNGEYIGPSLTTNHRAVFEVYASADSAGALYSTDGLGNVNRYFSN